MTVRTLARVALERVEAEREHVARGLTAYDRFADEFDAVDRVPRPLALGSSCTAGATVACERRSSGSDGGTITALFRETVHPFGLAHHDGATSLPETMRAELGEDLASALEPAVSGRVPPQVREALASAVDVRRTMLRTVERALCVEERSLRDALEAVEAITDWLVEANERPVSERGFEGLRRYHERLTDHSDRCDAVARRRQSVLNGTTARGTVELEHESLVVHCYDGLRTDYPVLWTVARLEECCRTCRRVVRDHLTRRV